MFSKIDKQIRVKTGHGLIAKVGSKEAEIFKNRNMPSPTPTSSQPTKGPLSKKKAKKKRTKSYRQGFASTIKTSPKGLYKGDNETLGS